MSECREIEREREREGEREDIFSCKEVIKIEILKHGITDGRNSGFSSIYMYIILY